MITRLAAAAVQAVCYPELLYPSPQEILTQSPLALAQQVEHITP
jgi:hypothetical protein